MEVMANHTMSHDALNSAHDHQMAAHDHQMASIKPEPTMSQNNGSMREPTNQSMLTRECVNMEAINREGSNHEAMNEEANTSIGCQTALSYAKQDTLVPMTALLQLVNNSILTVMENIEKVLVNASEEGIFTTDSINSFWNAAINSSVASPTGSGPQERASPSAFQDPREPEPMGECPCPGGQNNSEKLVRPIVIQDGFRNSLEIPTNGMETLGAADKKYCQESHEVQGQTYTSSMAMQDDLPLTMNPMNASVDPTSLSPTVNVAGSLTKYICPYCYKVFNWKTNMNRHISVTHLMKPKPTIKVPIMRKSKPYTCPICGNTFAWRSNMNRHILHLHKIDHKQLNKLLLSAYLPDIRNNESPNSSTITTSTSNPPTPTAPEPESYSSLGSLTMLPQLSQNGFKAVTSSPPPHSSTPKSSSFCATSPDHLTFLYRNHKALLESVKKEQVPIHVKEAALTSFYQNNKGLFDSQVSSISYTTPTSSGLLSSPVNLPTPPKSADSKLSPPVTCISNLSVLYQKALLEQRNAAAAAAVSVAPPPPPPDLSTVYQNHRAMLDTVNLLSNLNTIGVSKAGEMEIKMEDPNK